jgi:hypothetical protein
VFKSTVEVHDAAGARVGQIVQENIVGKKRFRLDGPSEEVLGTLMMASAAGVDTALKQDDT